ncbi:MAG: DUF1467 family protein [Pseudomonadota bacterium]
MTFYGGLIMYVVLWWLVLFCVLPWGARSQAEQGEVTKGTEHGAPVHPGLKIKLFWTTFIATLFWGVVWYVFETGLFSLANYIKS